MLKASCNSSQPRGGSPGGWAHLPKPLPGTFCRCVSPPAPRRRAGGTEVRVVPLPMGDWFVLAVWTLTFVNPFPMLRSPFIFVCSPPLHTSLPGQWWDTAVLQTRAQPGFRQQYLYLPLLSQSLIQHSLGIYLPFSEPNDDSRDTSSVPTY